MERVELKPDTRKDLIVIETSIDDFHKIFYIPTINVLIFYRPHVRIISTHH